MSPVDRLCSRLKATPWVGMAWLFGSRARGHSRADSDWDVALWVSCLPTREQQWALAEQLEAELAAPVDLVCLNRAESPLALEALGGQLLFYRDADKFSAFVSRVCRLAEDDALHQRQGLRWWREARAT